MKDGITCGTDLDVGRHIKAGATGKTTAEDSITHEAFEGEWRDAGCEAAAPQNDPNAKVWHLFPDDIEAADLLKAARTLLSENLVDFPSSRFRHSYVHLTESEGEKRYVLCGEINSKNHMGGYTGWKGFAASDKDGDARWHLWVESERDFEALAMLVQLCATEESAWIRNDIDYSKSLAPHSSEN